MRFFRDLLDAFAVALVGISLAIITSWVVVWLFLHILGMAISK